MSRRILPAIFGSRRKAIGATLHAASGNSVGGRVRSYFIEPLESRLLLSAIIYVDGIAPGPVNGGSSWANAYTSLQTALGVAMSGQTIEVGQGTYTPTTGEDRTATFQLIDGVSILGGFAGYGTANPDARNVAAFPTVLSGDIGVVGNNSDNSYHVVNGSNTNSTAILDGFTITGGNADGSGDVNSRNGAGMFNSGGNPTINNCTFSGNAAPIESGAGGGMYNYSSSPILTNCTFSGNTAIESSGGGMANDESSPMLTDCTFTGNTATNGGGGGMFNESSSSPTLTNCTFSGNTTRDGGGGMYNYSSSPILTNCTFSGNTATDSGGGGMVNGSSSSPTLTNCTFSGNTAGLGGGMGNLESSPMLTDCTFTGNTATNGGGGGMYNRLSSSPTLTNCTFSGNSVGVNGGYGYGGGMYNESSSSPTLTNCTFTGNSASFGGGMDNNNSSLPTLTNCIFWNDSDQYGGGNPEIYNDSTSTLSVTYSDVEGGFAGAGNIDADPLFVNAAAGNLQLQAISPCIDVGNNAAIEATGVTTDLAGNPRTFNGIVDMGAYEFQGSPSAVTWTGSGDGINWNNYYNWSDYLVPTRYQSVTIPAGVPVIDVGGGAFSVGSLTNSSSIEILPGGSLTLFGSAVVTGALTLDPGGTLDIQNNSLTINYGAGADPVANVRRYIRFAYDGGLWDGAGLTSGAVEAQVASAIANKGSGVYALGYEDGAVDIGQSVAVGNQLVIEPAIVGDTDLNGSTNFFDLGRVAQNLGAINADWYHGDFNYDGSVNFLDIGLLAQNLSKTTINTPLGAEVLGVSAASALAPSPDGKPSPALRLPSPVRLGSPQAIRASSPQAGVPGEGQILPASFAAWPSSSPTAIGLFSETPLDDLLA
jgi:parallel beta-helix repeat protein